MSPFLSHDAVIRMLGSSFGVMVEPWAILMNPLLSNLPIFSVTYLTK